MGKLYRFKSKKEVEQEIEEKFKEMLKNSPYPLIFKWVLRLLNRDPMDKLEFLANLKVGERATQEGMTSALQIATYCEEETDNMSFVEALDLIGINFEPEGK